MVCSKFTSLITPSTQDALIDGIESMLVTNGGFSTVSKTNSARSGTTFWGSNVAGGNIRELRIGKASIGLYLVFRCWLNTSTGRFTLFAHIANSSFSTIFPAEATGVSANSSTSAYIKASGISHDSAASAVSGFDPWVQSLRSAADLRITMWMDSSLDQYLVLSFDHEMRGGLGPGHQSMWCTFRVCEDVQSSFDATNNWMIVGKGQDTTAVPSSLGQQLLAAITRTQDDSADHVYTVNFNNYSSNVSPVLNVEGFGVFLAKSPIGACVEAPNYYGNLEIIKNCWRTYLNWFNHPNRTSFAYYNYVGRLSSDLAIGPGGLVAPTGTRIIVTAGVEEYDLTSSKPSPGHFPYGPALYVRAV